MGSGQSGNYGIRLRNTILVKSHIFNQRELTSTPHSLWTGCQDPGLLHHVAGYAPPPRYRMLHRMLGCGE